MNDQGEDDLGQVLASLWETIKSRRDADAGSSYTARLLSSGISRVAQKVGEEANETVIAAVGGDASETVLESADLLYHLLVLWLATGVEPVEVAKELRSRVRSAGEAGG